VGQSALLSAFGGQPPPQSRAAELRASMRPLPE